MENEDEIIGMLTPATLAMVVADLRGDDADEESRSFGAKCFTALRAIVGTDSAERMVAEYQG